MDRSGCFFKSKPIILLNKYQRWRRIAVILKLSKNARLRLEWIIFYQTKACENARLTCRHFGISPKTFYKWLKLFDENNLRSLADRSRAPRGKRRPEYTSLEVQRMIALRLKYPTLGRDKLIVVYPEEFGEKIKYWSARRIIADFGLYAERAIKSKRQKAQGLVIKKKRITDLIKKPFSGFLLELDCIVIYFNEHKRYVLTAIDYHSRFGFAFMYSSKASKWAADFLKRLALLYGGQIENIHIDNGSEFKKEFLKAAKQLGITLYHARPYQAKDKPLIERFNGIIQQEYIDLGNFTLDVEEFNRDLMDWIIFYNFIRPHHSLGLKRPIDYVKMKTKVLPMWSPITRG